MKNGFDKDALNFFFNKTLTSTKKKIFPKVEKMPHFFLLQTNARIHKIFTRFIIGNPYPSYDIRYSSYLNIISKLTLRFCYT